MSFYIISATETSFHLEFENIPQNLDNLIDEAITFCPDLFEAPPYELRKEYEKETQEGYLLLEKQEMIKLVKDYRQISFWWD